MFQWFKAHPFSSLLPLLVVLTTLAALVLLSGDGPRSPSASAGSPPTLTIVKQTVPAGATQPFTFTRDDTGPPPPVPSSFALLDGQSITFNFSPGDDLFNSITEIVPAGWVLTNIVCTGQVVSVVGIISSTSGGPPATFEPGDDTATIDLAGGENVTCTFTNEMLESGSITICKQTDPDGGTGFNFGWSSPTIHPAPFVLDDDECFTASDLGPASGPYTFTELQPLPAGWQLAYITCSGGASILIGSDSVYDPGDFSVTINLAAGENVVCTFINVQANTVSWGDLDCNGDITPVDSLKTLRFDAGLNVDQEPGCPEVGSEVIVRS